MGAAADRGFNAARIGFATSGPTAQSESDMIKFLRDFSSEYSDEKLREVLIRSSWDTQKALDLVCDLTYEENKCGHQKKSIETRSLFCQRMSGAGQMVDQMNAGSAAASQQSFASQATY